MMAGMPEHLRRLLAEAAVVPAVNQIEIHPYFQQTTLRSQHAQHGILSQAARSASPWRTAVWLCCDR